MSKTILQEMTTAACSVLWTYRDCHDPLRNSILRGEIAAAVAAACKRIAEARMAPKGRCS